MCERERESVCLSVCLCVCVLHREGVLADGPHGDPDRTAHGMLTTAKCANSGNAAEPQGILTGCGNAADGA